MVSPIDLPCWLTLPALPENVWSSSRKCWRKTGSDECLRSRNRSWGCSAASSPRWALTHQHLRVGDSSLWIPLVRPHLVPLAFAQTGEKSRDDALEAIKGNLDGFSRDAKMHPTPSSQSKKAGRFWRRSLRFPDSFCSIAFTQCECSEISQQVPHHIYPVTESLVARIASLFSFLYVF